MGQPPAQVPVFPLCGLGTSSTLDPTNPPHQASTSDRPSPSRGAAGQPRVGGSRPPLSGDQSSPSPGLRPRNTKRGLRSLTRILERKTERTTRRRIARQAHNTGQDKAALAAQELHTSPTLTHNYPYNIATLNICGCRQAAKRDEIQQHMTKQDISIMAIQETHTPHNGMETRKTHTWYFSGHERNTPEHHGTGIIISHHIKQYLLDVQPISSRLIVARFAATTNLTIVSAYAPTADHDTTEKQQFYTQLSQLVNKHKHKGPLLILGDYNAKLQYRETKLEQTHRTSPFPPRPPSVYSGRRQGKQATLR